MISPNPVSSLKRKLKNRIFRNDAAGLIGVLAPFVDNLPLTAVHIANPIELQTLFSLVTGM